jgi:sporulation protein YlmC with PRC-barrel domain
MLHSAKELMGLSISATDGEFGTIKDLYFDDAHWTIRYLVVDTGGWISGREVLIPINALAGADWPDEIVHVNLAKEQIRSSPGIDSDMPVSRQHEAGLYQHFGYPYYWRGPHMWGDAVYPVPMDSSDDPGLQDRKETTEMTAANSDPHLRSSNEVIGYTIQATDDTVGHVEDFMLDDKDWSIRLMVVDTRNWWPGKKVLVAPQRIERVSWSERKVAVDISREAVENSPEYDPDNPPPLGPGNDLYRRFDAPRA